MRILAGVGNLSGMAGAGGGNAHVHHFLLEGTVEAFSVSLGLVYF
jgi:hypothetical protein